MLPLTALPPLRKPRERLWSQGPSSLEIEELVAVLLGSGCGKVPVSTLSVQVAQALRQGKHSPAELATISGIGPAKAAVVAAALQVGSRLAQLVPPELTTPEQVYAQCLDLLTLPQEHLVAFYLNVRAQPLYRETISIGTATASLLHPREVFRPAITHNATHIILAHNHPSGVPQPSQADTLSTRRIAQAGHCVGIELLDHVICAKNGYVSLRSDHPDLFS